MLLLDRALRDEVDHADRPVLPQAMDRPTRWSRIAGFQGRSMLTTVEAFCRFRPTPPASRGKEHAAVRGLFELRNQVPPVLGVDPAVEQRIFPCRRIRAGSGAARACPATG